MVPPKKNGVLEVVDDPRGHVTPPCRAFGSLCQKKWKKRGWRTLKNKKVAYRAPAALCCWLFDVDIIGTIDTSELKEASASDEYIHFHYMFQLQHCKHCVAPYKEKSKYHHPPLSQDPLPTCAAA